MGLRATRTASNQGRFAVFCCPFSSQHCLIGSSECVQTSEARQKTDVFHTISSQIMRLFPCMLLALPLSLLSAKYNGMETMKKRQMYNCSVYAKVGKISLHSEEVFKHMRLFLQIQKNFHHPKRQGMSKEYNTCKILHSSLPGITIQDQ